MPDKQAALYAEAVARPEYREMVGYLTSRGVTPQGRNVPLVSEVKSVDDLVYELTHVARNEMDKQAEQMPKGELAKLVNSVTQNPARGADGATNFRVMLDLAIREHQAQQPKPRPML